MITYEFIKKRVEDETGLIDISIKSNKRLYVEARSIYYKLCYLYHPYYTCSDCGSFVGFDYSNVLHHLKQFNYIFNDDSFRYQNEYYIISASLKKAYKEIDTSKVQINKYLSKGKLISIIKDKVTVIGNLTKEVADLRLELAKSIEVKYELIAS